MTIESKKLIFDTFLKSHKAHKAYYANISVSLDVLLKGSLDDLILGAFSWISTKQGHEFWSELNEKWEAFAQAISA